MCNRLIAVNQNILGQIYPGYYFCDFGSLYKFIWDT